MKSLLKTMVCAAALTGAATVASAASFDVIASGGEVLGRFSYQENVDGKFLYVSFIDNALEDLNATSLTFTYLNKNDKVPSSWTIDLDPTTFSTLAPVKVAGAFSTFGSFTSAAVTSPVPEPETYALMVAGLGVVGWAARRRKAIAPATPAIAA